MHWILLIWINSINGGFHQMEFSTQTNCDTAKIEFLKEFPEEPPKDQISGWAQCVEK